jgi:hypothetical protein
MGYLKNHLSSDDKQELLGLIEDYRQGLVPLIVPLTLLKHHLNRYPVPDWVPGPSGYTSRYICIRIPRSSCCGTTCRPVVSDYASGGFRIRMRVVRLERFCRLCPVS